MDYFASLSRSALLEIAAIVVAAGVAIFLAQRLVPRLAERLPSRYRLLALATVPLLRLAILVTALVLIVAPVIEPRFESVLALLGALGLALGFAFKDYVSSLIAGIVVLYEMPYRLGDWVRIDGAYGEVRSIGMRALKIVTPDDDAVVIPHAKLWTTSIHNANDGTRQLQCAADFYLHPRHDAGVVRAALHDVGLTSPYLDVERATAVVVRERPWGTHYRLKGYPVDARDQFQLSSDLTVRGKQALAALGVEPVCAPACPVGPEGTA